VSLNSAGIIGTGYYVPEEIRTNDWFSHLPDLNLDPVLDQVFIDSGVKERRICAKGEKSSDMETKALLAAVENAGISVEDIDLILNGSAMDDQFAPKNASLVQYKSGAKNAASLNVDMACSTLLSQMGLAWGMIASGLYKTVACVVSTDWTRIADYTDASCLFVGDGAAAIIMQPVTPGKGMLSIEMVSEGQYHAAIGVTIRLPKIAYTKNYQRAMYEPSQEQFLFHIQKDHPGFIELNENSPVKFAEMSRKALAKAGLTVADVDHFIPHQPPISVVNQWREAIGIAPNKMYITIEKFGNVSAASVGINLHEISAMGKLKEEDVVLMIAPAAGHQYAAVVLRWGQ
jgi:3-oxoacyl-[acyl-carrier-protein] synthase-3